jgi:hypothetical protein
MLTMLSPCEIVFLSLYRYYIVFAVILVDAETPNSAREFWEIAQNQRKIPLQFHLPVIDL